MFKFENLSFFLSFVTEGKRIYFFLLLPRTIESDLVSHPGEKNFKICQIPAPCPHSPAPPIPPMGFTLTGALDSGKCFAPMNHGS